MNAAHHAASPDPQGAPGAPTAWSDLARDLSDGRTLEEVMATASRGLRTLLQADGVSFVLRDGDRCYYAEEDAISPLWKGRRFPQKTCVSGWCMTHGQAVAIPDIAQDARVPLDAYRPTFVRSLIMAPVCRTEPVAALGAYWAETRQFSSDEIDRLQAVADVTAKAFERLRPSLAAKPDGPVARAKEPNGLRPPAARGPTFRDRLSRIRRNGLRPNSPEAYAFAMVCVLVATLVREGFRASGANGLAVFSTYYPAVLVAMLMGGRRCGLLAAGLGGLAAYYFFIPPLHRLAPLTLSEGLNLALYGAASAAIVLSIDWYKRTVLRLREEDARHLILAREQGHRVQNAVAVVESVVRQSLADQPERARTINRRIRAGLTQVDLQDPAVHPASTLRELLVAELEPYDLARFTLDGAEVAGASAQSRSILTLVIHELATNAAKYGALSVPDGRVTVRWSATHGAANMVWREAGGPRVQPPQKRGYGSVLLQRLLHSTGGALAIGYPPEGVTAEISLPLSQRPGAKDGRHRPATE